jgi:hypothetical protein
MNEYIRAGWLVAFLVLMIFAYIWLSRRENK